MKSNPYKSFQILLGLEIGARNQYSEFLRTIERPDFAKDIARVRDEEIEHIALVKELFSILESGVKPNAGKRKIESLDKSWVKERDKLINAANVILETKINLISQLEKLDKLNWELKELNKIKSEFVSIAAHQIRNPLSSMKWFFEGLLRGSFGKLDQKQTGLIQEIYQANERLVNIVSDLLKISRLEERKTLEKEEKINLYEFIEEILNRYKPAIDEKGLKISHKKPEGTLGIICFKSLLENIFDNLISNAVKYTLDNDQIKINLKSSGKRISGSISDNGIGIPKEDRNKIFDKFFRAENAKMADRKGTGLGLNIARESARKLGGEIRFKPNKPRGTIFYFLLPKSR